MVILWAVICNKDRVPNHSSLPKDTSLPRPPKVSVVVVVVEEEDSVVVVEEEDLCVLEVDCLSYVFKIFVEVLYFLLVPKKDNNSNNNVVYSIIRVLV